jgi:hypothetical protein
MGNILAYEAIPAQIEFLRFRIPGCRETIQFFTEYESTHGGQETTEYILSWLDFIKGGHRIGEFDCAGGGRGTDLIEIGVAWVKFAKTLEETIIGVIVHLQGSTVIVGGGGFFESSNNLGGGRHAGNSGGSKKSQFFTASYFVRFVAEVVIERERVTEIVGDWDRDREIV